MQALEKIEDGKIYHFTANARVETAEVLSVGTDRLGIPHVRFQLRVRCAGNAPTVEERTLALASFRDRYKERL